MPLQTGRALQLRAQFTKLEGRRACLHCHSPAIATTVRRTEHHQQGCYLTVRVWANGLICQGLFPQLKEKKTKQSESRDEVSYVYSPKMSSEEPLFPLVHQQSC